MNLSKIAVDKPTTTLIIFILLVGLAFYTSTGLTIDLFPKINPPVLLIFTDYAGTGPEEIEKTVTRPLESALSNVANIEKIESVSSEGTSQITVTFTWGTDMSEAANDVRDKLEFVKDYLPDEVKSPMIFKFDPSMMPIITFALGGNRSPDELKKIGEDIVVPKLEQVEGVSMVNIIGGRDRIIRVEIEQNRLDAYNLNLTTVANMLRGQNIQISAGTITEGNKNFLVRTAGEYQDIEQIKNTVISYYNTGSTTKFGNSMAMTQNSNSAKVIRLRDIANVYDGYRDADELAYINGVPGIYLSVQKQSGKNSVKTADNVFYKIYKQKKIPEDMSKYTPKPGSLMAQLPRDVEIEIIHDFTQTIRDSIGQVSSTAIIGAFLAIFILLIFLRSIKSVFIIGLAIPISVLITLMLMYFTGLTLNIMTLAGLALGIGMLVDNSIVILENIYRYREKGTKLTTAAILGSKEMIGAISASTLTTVVVFAPLVMFKNQLEMAGQLFMGLAFTVVFSLLSSLFVAIFLVPVLSSKYLPLKSRIEEPLTGILGIIDSTMGKFFTALDNFYKKTLSIVLNHKKISLLIVGGVFILSLFILSGIGFKFMPKSESDFIRLSVEMPVGTKLDITKEVVMQFEDIITREVRGYKNLVTMVGIKSFHGFMGSVSSYKGRITITLPEYSKRIDHEDDIKRKLRKHFNDFPSAKFKFTSMNFMGGSASPIDIILKTDNLTKGKKIADQIKQLIKDELPEVKEPQIDLGDGLPQIEIFIDRDKAYSLGLNVYSVGNEIRASIDGITASKYRTEGSEYDIVVILEKQDRNSLPDLDKIFVKNSFGQKIPLSSFAYLKKTTGPINIYREDQRRTIHIRADLAKTVTINGKKKKVTLSKVEPKLRKLINDNIPYDKEVIIDYSGDYADMIKYAMKFMLIMVIAIFLVFGIMASQFESFLDPFIIFFTVPLTLIGISLMYLLTGEILSLYTIVGFVVLLGIVVNNGIVLVDYTNLLRKRGLNIHDACVTAGGNRLRPILMTTLTTILGLLPMAFLKGEGSDLSQPIARTVVGGLTTSMVFTLYLVPIIYAIFNQFSDKLKGKQRLKREKQLASRKEYFKNN